MVGWVGFVSNFVSELCLYQFGMHMYAILAQAQCAPQSSSARPPCGLRGADGRCGSGVFGYPRRHSVATLGGTGVGLTLPCSLQPGSPFGVAWLANWAALRVAWLARLQGTSVYLRPCCTPKPPRHRIRGSYKCPTSKKGRVGGSSGLPSRMSVCAQP